MRGGICMTVALYCRVSTDEQATQGFSLEAQQQRLEAFCVSQGWDDFICIVDDGYSGTTMDRPGLKKLIHAANRKQINAVIVYRLDRLSRKQRDVLYLLEDVFDANNVTFRSATEPFDTSTPLGRAMLGILAVFAQLERDTIIERTKGGLRQRVSRGLWSGARYPFGYRMNKDTGVLEIVPEEAALVREVYRKFLAGENRASIQRWLEKRTTARDVNTLFTRRLLTRETYTGKVVLNGEVFEGQHEAIIDQETFDKVQAKITNLIIPRGGERHLLTSLIQCGVCGDNMSYWESHQKRPHITHKYMRLICNSKRKKSANCASKSILAREVEAEVSRIILSAPLDVPLAATKQNVQEEEVIYELEKQLMHVAEQRRSLLDAVQQGLPFSTVKDRFDDLEKQRQSAQAQLDDIMIAKPPQVDAENLVSVLKQAQRVWEHLDWQEQRTMLKVLIRKARVYPDKHVEVEWNL